MLWLPSGTSRFWGLVAGKSFVDSWSRCNPNEAHSFKGLEQPLPGYRCCESGFAAFFNPELGRLAPHEDKILIDPQIIIAYVESPNFALWCERVEDGDSGAGNSGLEEAFLL